MAHFKLRNNHQHLIVTSSCLTVTWNIKIKSPPLEAKPAVRRRVELVARLHLPLYLGGGNE